MRGEYTVYPLIRSSEKIRPEFPNYKTNNLLEPYERFSLPLLAKVSREKISRD
jgi:hypothetical protein